jgi:hypothetical protein
MAGRDQHDWLLALSSIPQLASCKDSITNRTMFIYCLTAAADWVPTVGTGFSGLLPVHDRGLIDATRGD